MSHSVKGEFIRSVAIERERFGRHLTAAMAARSITSRQLALASGVADPTIVMLANGWQNSVGNIALYTLVGIADGLGLPHDEVARWATDDIIARKHFLEAQKKACERARRYRARMQAAEPGKPEPELVVPAVAPVDPPNLGKAVPAADFSAVSLASVMVKLRRLTVDDLILIDELISELT